MVKFAENFVELTGRPADITIKHILWVEDSYRVDKLQVINDENCLGVMIHGHKIFMYKKNIVTYNVTSKVYTFSDGRLTLIVAKL